MFSLLCCVGAGCSIPLSLSESSFCPGTRAGMPTHGTRHSCPTGIGAGLLSPQLPSALNQDLLKQAHLSDMLHRSVISEQNPYQPVTLPFKNAVALSDGGRMVLYSIPGPYSALSLLRMVQVSFAKCSQK